MLQAEHSATLFTFIKLPFVIKIFVLFKVAVLHWFNCIFLYYLGSCEESVTLELATRLSSGRTVSVAEPSASDIDFTFNTDMQRTGDFNVNLNMKNTSTESRLVDVHVSALSCKYTGIPNADIKDTCTATVLEPNARK